MTSTDGACPYCNSEDSCEHLLLQVDLTFRDAVGGELYELFRKKWFSILEANEDSDNFDEREHLNSCSRMWPVLLKQKVAGNLKEGQVNLAIIRPTSALVQNLHQRP